MHGLAELDQQADPVEEQVRVELFERAVSCELKLLGVKLGVLEDCDSLVAKALDSHPVNGSQQVKVCIPIKVFKLAHHVRKLVIGSRNGQDLCGVDVALSN